MSNARDVMSMSSSCVMVRPVSSWISRAAAPAKLPLSSSMPAGSSVKDRLPAAMRGCTVRMAYSSGSFVVDESSDDAEGDGEGVRMINMATLPPRMKTAPGKDSPSSFLTEALNFKNPIFELEKMSTPWISMLRKV